MATRAKLSVTVDAGTLEVVDRYVAAHVGTDRSKLVDEALSLWVAAEQRRAMREQYEPLTEPDERMLREERAAWNAIRDQAGGRMLKSER